MAEVKWIKITTDIFNDEKILLIEQMPEADTMLVIWLKLLCMAGKENNYGVFLMRNRMPYTEEMLATIFRRPLNTVRLALSTFEAFGMIEIEDDVICIPNWEKHQNIDGMQKIREHTRKRVADYRQRQKLLAMENNVTENVTLRNATDKNREEKKREEKIKQTQSLLDSYNSAGAIEPKDYLALRKLAATDPDKVYELLQDSGNYKESGLILGFLPWKTAGNKNKFKIGVNLDNKNTKGL